MGSMQMHPNSIHSMLISNGIIVFNHTSNNMLAFAHDKVICSIPLHENFQLIRYVYNSVKVYFLKIQAKLYIRDRYLLSKIKLYIFQSSTFRITKETSHIFEWE